MRVGFHEELDELQQSLQAEGELVVRSVQAVTRALVEQDLELADEVIAFDDEVDAHYFGIQEGIQSLLARQTPVASDLRLVLAMLHVNLHLERMADYCVTVAKLTKLAGTGPPATRIAAALAEMGVRAEEMTRVALRSFEHRDVVRAEALVGLDELIDRTNRRLVEHVLELEEAHREWGLRMLVVSRCLERVGDHAVDIGEQTAYLVRGVFHEFTDASRPEGMTAA
jgi:phosphate transport system protein